MPKPVFYLCGCCEHYHPKGFVGDCRDDDNRFHIDVLDETYSPDGWIEQQFEINYVCDCGNDWTDYYTCTCNGECEECGENRANLTGE